MITLGLGSACEPVVGACKQMLPLAAIFPVHVNLAWQLHVHRGSYSQVVAREIASR